MNAVADALRLHSTDPREIENFAGRLLAFYKLDGWTFGWDNAKRRLGLCDHRRRRVSVSRFFVAGDPTPAAVEDTLRHELAHALVGPGLGHCAVWKAKVVEVGARPQRCGHAAMPAATRWRATCSCGQTFRRFRRPRRLTGWYCRRYGPGPRGRLEWKLNVGRGVRDAT